MQLVSICGPRLHQIKQIVIPAYQVVRLNFDCEVEVRLVIDVSGEGKSFRNSSDKLSGFAQPFDECRKLSRRSIQKTALECLGEREHLLSHREYRC